MAQLSTRSPSRRRGDGRGAATPSSVVPLASLSLNPIVVDVARDGAASRVTVLRVNGSHARVTCTCAPYATETWCEHCVEVLCLAPQIVSGLDAAAETALRQLVSGLPIAADAQRLASAQDSFAASLRRFDAERPDGVSGEKLSIFTELVSELAVSSSELEDAIGRLRRSMEASKRFPAPSNQPSAATD